MTPKKKRTQKFPAEEVGPLLIMAQGKDISEIEEQHAWIRQLTPIEARNILLERFHSIIATLIDVCLKGKYFTSYTKTFLKLFGAKGKDMQNIANMLKKELSCYTKQELWHTGQVAVLIAIEKCESNLSSTIVYKFKDLIDKMIEDRNKQQPGLEVVEALAISYNLDEELSLSIFISELDESEQELVADILAGEKYDSKKIPIQLKNKFYAYLNGPNSSIEI